MSNLKFFLGESDAAFTPSPPISSENNVTMALAHQTRIRNLYSTNSNIKDVGDIQIQNAQRPDSSSSASSATDWEGSGHATVLRRANQSQSQILPPMSKDSLRPLVDSLRPLAPLYNNMNTGISAVAALPISTGLETSGSDFERMLESRERITHKPPFMSRKIPNEISIMDRLSVRTEVSNNLPDAPSTLRKPLTIPDDDDTVLPFKFNANNLYFSPNDCEVNQLIDQQHKDATVVNPNGKDNKLGKTTHNKNIQDSIMRQINREMTPTISEVYHERNLGLGLAPPLSKLLLSKNYEENDAIETNEANATEPNENVDEDQCTICNGPSEILCNCQSNAASAKKLAASKPWLNCISSNPSDTSNSNILEHQTKLNAIIDIDATDIQEANDGTKRNSTSPFPDLSKRDEGDGRSVADSQCSSNYKVVDLSTNAKVSQIQKCINKFNMNSND